MKKVVVLPGAGRPQEEKTQLVRNRKKIVGRKKRPEGFQPLSSTKQCKAMLSEEQNIWN